MNIKAENYISTDKERKTVAIQARCSKEIKDKIKISANQAGKSVTEFIISCCLPEVDSQRIQSDLLKTNIRDRLLFQQHINEFVNYVRFRMGYDRELENEINKLIEGGKEHGFISNDGH